MLLEHPLRPNQIRVGSASSTPTSIALLAVAIIRAVVALLLVAS